ncbi:MAG: hypothetical protein ACR2PX_04400, partial [Endozoicomonas sp.]|uniref:hypothetical protein n=1 Tax=Endozoicomonas sp. TaxID=1892382 RepID=UPI003D9BE63B
CQPAAVMLIVPRQAWHKSHSSRLVPQSTRIFLRQTLKTAESSETHRVARIEPVIKRRKFCLMPI